MSQQFLDFEQPIAELEAKINELRMLDDDSEVKLTDEIARLEKKCVQKTKSVFAALTPWQVAQMARHPLRPHTVDYIEQVFTDFDELHGDRHCSNGPAIVGGIARLDGKPVMVIGNEKGNRTKDKIYRNFGMALPEAYRKALRLMQLAEKFNLPVITLIDTSGAYPGIDAEERNQSEAIARNLFVMSQLATQIVCLVIGEGGSGGALAIGVGDRVLMLEYSIYSVISPEGCASILWKSADKAADAATAMRITAAQLYELGLVDRVLPEPLGGAHKNSSLMVERVRAALIKELDELQKLPMAKLLAQRYQRLMDIGV